MEILLHILVKLVTLLVKHAMDPAIKTVRVVKTMY